MTSETNATPKKTPTGLIPYITYNSFEGIAIEDDQNVSLTANETQASLDETTSQTGEVQQEEPKSIVKSVRKSVQIMTPENEKTHSAEKRIDTPYSTVATTHDNQKIVPDSVVEDEQEDEQSEIESIDDEVEKVGLSIS